MLAPTQTTTAILMLLAATLLFAVQDTLTKHLMQTISAPQIVVVRFFFFALFALFYVARSRGVGVAWRTKHRWLQPVRGLLLAGEIIVFAYAIQFLGIAEIHTIFACFPLIITALSVPFLGEEVGWRRWLAVCCGFIGTLIILRPGATAGVDGFLQPAAVIALTSALMFSVYNILTRKVAARDSFETSLLYVGVFGFIGGLIIAPFYWRPVAAADLGWLLAISVTSIISHLLLIKALSLAPAVILQPFNYFVLVWAIIIGFVLYGEVLSATTLFGAAIVVASGVFIARREYKLRYRAN